MGFFGSLFVKSAADLLKKGDDYLAADRFYEAKNCYEDALSSCVTSNDDAVKSKLVSRIESANNGLAGLNLHEAENTFRLGNHEKAYEYLELVKTLTYDVSIREKAEKLANEYALNPVQEDKTNHGGSCGSCAGHLSPEGSESLPPDNSLSTMEHYELLIQQLPPDQYTRYEDLGEKFAYAYISASRDEHNEALRSLELCRYVVPEDIFLCEKGKLLHRLGSEAESEICLRQSVEINRLNSLAWLNLALVVMENGRFVDTMEILDSMVAADMLTGQALLMRAEVLAASGDSHSSIEQYINLLNSPFARVAAEGLCGVLVSVGRNDDAAVIVKKYLGKSCH